jgi:starch phosphorylase
LIIKLANDVANVINNDPLVGDLLKIVFLPNYNVSLAELIVPSADLSEQISTAGMEASGTGNMKLALNGALTIGTFDGANIEIGEHVGDDNIFIFGLRAAGVAERRRRGLDTTEVINASPDLSDVVDAVAMGCFSPEDPHRFAGLVHALRYSDPFMVAADFEAYREAQREVDELWRSPRKWRRSALLNIAGMSWFSSDRAIAQYAEEIWDIPVSGKLT